MLKVGQELGQSATAVTPGFTCLLTHLSVLSPRRTREPLCLVGMRVGAYLLVLCRQSPLLETWRVTVHLLCCQGGSQRALACTLLWFIHSDFQTAFWPERIVDHFLTKISKTNQSSPSAFARV